MEDAVIVVGAHNTPHAPSSPSKRRKVVTEKHGGVRKCSHCGRTFKRTEHLDRHVRTHTKEKPFACHCGASFARRDLLTRHHKIAGHEGTSPAIHDRPNTAISSGHLNHGLGTAEADLAAAISLSDLSANHGQYPLPNPQTAVQEVVDSGNGYPDLIGQNEYLPGLSTQICAGGIDFDTQVRDFTSFLDGIGLSTEWSPYFDDPQMYGEASGPSISLQHAVPAQSQTDVGTRASTPFNSWLPSAPTGQKFTHHESEPCNIRSTSLEAGLFKVTEEHRATLRSTTDKISHLLSSAFRLPSRHALTRYITSYFNGFHSHLPFIHAPTWHITKHPAELVLGIAAIGAQYCFERKVSEHLFYAGKAVLMARLRRNAESLDPMTRASLVMSQPMAFPDAAAESDDDVPLIGTVKALIALMGFATWEPKTSLVQESFALHGMLTNMLRNVGTTESHSSTALVDVQGEHLTLNQAWQDWVELETSRRAKLIAFSFLHTHSIAYDVYPTLRSNEIDLRLPCSTKEWTATNAILWHTSTTEVLKPQLFFQEALSLLLRPREDSTPLDPIPTPLGNYVLLHGLLQRIHIVRDLSLPVMSKTAALPIEEVKKLEHGLRSWTSGWQQAPESSLDPENENGPIPFTSSSLLALAYVRIYLHLGPYRCLETRDPQLIASAISRCPDVERSDGITSALLYAVHMLGIPVKLGIDRVARSQAFFWSVRHSLASLECAVLLNKWLTTISATVSDAPMSESERRIMHWAKCVVEEAYAVIDFVDPATETEDFEDPAILALGVIRIWAHFFTSNTQWPIINMIGLSLDKYHAILVRQQETAA